MAWIRSETTIRKNHKILRIALKLELKPVEVIGHLHLFWHNVLDLREDGDITAWTNKEIAHYAEYEGNPDKFVEVLEDGLIDKKNGRRLIHDWLDYALPYLQSRYRTHKKEKLAEIIAKYEYGQTERSDRTVGLHTEQTKQTKHTTTPPETYLSEWNKKMPFKIRGLSDRRKKHLQERIEEKNFVDNFNLLMDKIIASPFLLGKKPSEKHPNFKADFDWLIGNNTNYLKILEGKYDERQTDAPR